MNASRCAWSFVPLMNFHARSCSLGSRDLAQQIASLSPDTTVKLGILRSREERVVIVKLGGELVKTEQLSATSQFNGEWRVVYA